MNYYQARQMKNPDGTGGKWHYTRMNDGRIWPTGYCAQGCPGHDTPEEAEEHQKQYDVDNARFDFSYADSATQRSVYKCEYPDCENWTRGFARIVGGGSDHTLCDNHRNKEGLAEVHRVGHVISSY